MKIEEHEKAYGEHLTNLKRFIEESVEENQRNIGYNVSQGSVELLAIYLHKLHLLEGSGDQLDRRIFKSNLVEKRVPPEFPNRDKILELMKNIEIERNNLCYGKRKPEGKVTGMIKNFNQLRRIINESLKNGRKK